MIQWIFSIVLTGALLFAVAAAITSFSERETRAGLLWILICLIPPGMLILPFFTGNEVVEIVYMITGSLMMGFSLIMLLPLRKKNPMQPAEPKTQFHEADHVLSRRRLVPGTTRYEEYYHSHPSYRIPDDRARAKPGLLSPGSRYYHPELFASAQSNFEKTEQLHSFCRGEPENSPREWDVNGIYREMKKSLLRTGAHSVGATPLKPYHLYSHRGRGERFNEPVENNHTHAIAFTVEMDHHAMQFAPDAPTVLESSARYLQSGQMATHLAGFLRRMGYQATAHIDGNYEVICPTVAADAGLGTIGRMGLLITPRLGPRVRIAVVTTNMPIPVRIHKPEPTMLDFCENCSKCARVCPSQAIPYGPRKEHNGVKRWKIVSEQCYLFWTITGTDCGLCMIHCPFSHPDNWLHAFIRWGIKNNLVFRRFATKLDDVFYGKKPKIRSMPSRPATKKRI